MSTLTGVGNEVIDILHIGETIRDLIKTYNINVSESVL
jgi:hypothetical protein